MDTTARGPSQAAGEEFRDDHRGAAAARAAGDIRRLLPADLLRELTQLGRWRAALAIGQTVAVAAMAVAVGWLFFTPWVVVPVLILLGTQQHALFVLAHDAAHDRLFGSRRLNDLFGPAFGMFARPRRAPSLPICAPPSTAQASS